jgi:transcriptional regulator with AAA-type ATPase domain
MKLFYVDDSDKYAEKVRLVGKHLGDMLGEAVDYSFVQPEEDEDKDFVFFDESGQVVSDLAQLPDVSPADLLSKAQVDTLSGAGEGIYLLDVSFVPGNNPLTRSLRRYGLGLAKHLQAGGHAGKYIFMFTNYSAEVMSNWAVDGAKCWEDTHAKEILSGPDDKQEEAARILAARIFGCITQTRPVAELPGSGDSPFPEIIGRSEGMQAVYRLIEKVAPTDSNVLIYGESGTGKELVARAIHNRSPRSAEMFQAVNCAAINENLLESELFGHGKGSFTGAHADHEGLFEVAEGGTLFLDEIGELDVSMQAKLLRAIQEREIRRVGGKRPIKIDVRVVAATNRDLSREVEEGRFREDLFYRLSVLPVSLPPLRERGDDVLLLVDNFIRLNNRKHGKRVRGLSPRVADAFRHYPWPGNVRQLSNEIERAVLLEETALISPSTMSEEIIRAAAQHNGRRGPKSAPADDAWTTWKGIKDDAKGGRVLAKIKDRIVGGDAESRSYVLKALSAAVSLACNNPDVVRSNTPYCQPIRKLMMLLEEMIEDGLLDRETLQAFAAQAGARGRLDFEKLKNEDGTYVNIGSPGLTQWKSLHREQLAGLIKSEASAAVVGS